MPHGRRSWASLGLDLVTLRIFVAAAQENSFAAAAARENIAISAISRRIADLEGRSGVMLFDRHDRGVSLTPAGQELLSHLAHLFDTLDRITWDLNAQRDGSSGFIRIRTHMTALSGFLPEMLASFLNSHPRIDVDIEELTSLDVLHAIRTGMGDIGLVAGAVSTDALHIIPWYEDDLVVMIPEKHALAAHHSLSLADVIDEPFIGMQRDSAIMRLYRQKAEAIGGKVRERAHATGFDSLRKMVAAGLGIAILPTAAAENVPGTAVRPLAEDWARRKLAICVRDPKLLSTAGRLLLEHLIKSIAIFPTAANNYVSSCAVKAHAA